MVGEADAPIKADGLFRACIPWCALHDARSNVEWQQALDAIG
jgi:hypothetical protein